MEKITNSSDDLVRSINSFKSHIDNKLKSLNDSLSLMINKTNDVKENVTEFKESMTKSDANILAKEHLSRLNKTIEEEYSDYENIRLRILDFVICGNVDIFKGQTKEELLDKLWINNSNYWLSYVGIALSAWVNDYTLIADNAILEAMQHNPRKTALFYCLLNYRFERLDNSKSWFLEYLKFVDESSIMNATLVLTKNYVKGVFGEDQKFAEEVNKLIEQWSYNILNNSNNKDIFIDKYYQYIDSIQYESGVNIKVIKDHCPEFKEISSILEELSKVNYLNNYIDSLEKNSSKEDKIEGNELFDDILKNLINEKDIYEQEVLCQREYLESVINSLFSNNSYIKPEVEAKLNIVEELINSVTNELESDTRLKLFALKNTKSLFLMAFEKWFYHIKDNIQKTFYLDIRGFQCELNGNDFDEQNKKLTKYYNQVVSSGKYFNNTNISIILIIMISLFFSNFVPYLLVLPIVLTFVMVLMIINKGKKVKENFSVDQKLLKSCVFEARDIINYIDLSLEKVDKVLEKIDSL